MIEVSTVQLGMNPETLQPFIGFSATINLEVAQDDQSSREEYAQALGLSILDQIASFREGDKIAGYPNLKL